MAHQHLSFHDVERLKISESEWFTSCDGGVSWATDIHIDNQIVTIFSDKPLVTEGIESTSSMGVDQGEAKGQYVDERA